MNPSNNRRSATCVARNDSALVTSPATAARSDALDELGLRASDLERGLDRLTLGQQRVEVSLGLSLVRLGRGSDALVPLGAEPFPQRCIAP